MGFCDWGEREVISRSQKLCAFSYCREAHSHSREPDGCSPVAKERRLLFGVLLQPVSEAMKNPAARAGYRKAFMTIFRTSSRPNVLSGDRVPDSPGFPLKACGNDEPRIA